MRTVMWCLPWVALLILAGGHGVDAASMTPPVNKYDVRILRDEWGVPHLFGKTDADAAYGLGFVHGEDDWVNTEDAVLSARGQMASVHGEAHAKSDYLIRLLRVREFVEAKYEQDLSPELRAVVEAYADGVTHFATLHRAKMPNIALPVTGKDIVVRAAFLSPFFYLLETDLAQFFDKAPGVPASGKGLISALLLPETPLSGAKEAPWTAREKLGSNAWAVGPSRSADGATRLAVNADEPVGLDFLAIGKR